MPDMNWIENCFGDPMKLAQQLIRPMLVAAPGHEFIVADFASIEARCVLWYGDETEALELFRSGADIYCELAKTIYERDITKADKTERQVGKQGILGLGFGMGPPKFRATCIIKAQVDVGKKMARKVVKAYRDKYSGVKNFWYSTERTAIEALQKGEPVENGRTTWLTRGRFLQCRLPSGRLLSYPDARIIIEPAWIFPCVDEDEKETTIMIVGRNKAKQRAMKRAADEDLKIIGPPIEKEKTVLTHMGLVKNQWVREATYGGKLVENIVQATARDLMAEAMLRAEDRKYYVVLTVHDEIVSEVPEGFGSVAEFEGIMAELPAWAEGCPVAAEGFKSKRYRK
jgi:DNA polymerase bacteriophage-type